jgi:ABC-type branched-subunit amino acid transport system ATPase component
MLALSRALMRKPRVPLLAELSLGLAPVIVERLLPVVRGWRARAGRAARLSPAAGRMHVAAAGGIETERQVGGGRNR